MKPAASQSKRTRDSNDIEELRLAHRTTRTHHGRDGKGTGLPAGVGISTQGLAAHGARYENTVLRIIGRMGASMGTWTTPSVIAWDDLLNSKTVRISRGTSPGNSALISFETLKSFMGEDTGTRVREQIVWRRVISPRCGPAPRSAR